MSGRVLETAIRTVDGQEFILFSYEPFTPEEVELFELTTGDEFRAIMYARLGAARFVPMDEPTEPV